MDPQHNLYNMIDEMSSVLLTLQTDMIKVMNGISQLNLLISKIKQYKENNSNNMMMNNMMNNMQNMGMGMNNMMGMQGINMPMSMDAMQGMMNNINFGNPNINIEDELGWNLIFENRNDGQTFLIRISEQKLFKEAISLYRLKSGNTERCEFKFNNRKLNPEMKICQTGLCNIQKIIVISY